VQFSWGGGSRIFVKEILAAKLGANDQYFEWNGCYILITTE
jgi:hypothetical protein